MDQEGWNRETTCYPTAACFEADPVPEISGYRVAPTFVLKYNIRTRSLADPGVIEDVLAVENDVVPFDRADVLEQGCVNAFLGDSPRSPRPCDLLACQVASRREDHGQVSIKMTVLLDVS